jgi:hypothetical protein
MAKSNIKIVERDQIDTSNRHVDDRSLPWLGTGTSMKSGGACLCGNRNGHHNTEL